MKIGVVNINHNLVKEVNRLTNENAALKKQIKDMRIKEVSKDVANHVQAWLDEPYNENISERQDIELFAYQITRYIDSRLK